MTYSRALRQILLTSSALLMGACSAFTAPYDANVAPSSQSDLAAMAARLASKGEHSAALPIYRQLARRGTIEALTSLGTSLVAMGEHVEAATILSQVTKSKNAPGMAWHSLGKAWLALSRYDEAVTAFTNASNKLIGDTKPRAALGIALAATGRVGEALGVLSAAHRMDEGDANIASNYALMLALSGKEKQAVTMLEGYVRDGKAMARDRQNLALAYLMNGNRDKAQAMARLDLDGETVAQTFAFYRELQGLEPKYRMQAMIEGSVDPAWTKREAGNLTLSESDSSKMAAMRLTVQEKPVIVPKPKPVKKRPVIPPLIDPEGWAVQVGAYRTIKNLIRGWDILFSKNEDILSRVEPRRSEKDFGERDTYPRGFYYRLNAGPLETYQEARVICRELKARGTDCWIRPPEVKEGRLPSKE